LRAVAASAPFSPLVFVASPEVVRALVLRADLAADGPTAAAAG
jgi:hypothetical protein